ncbi:MAG TPA: terpene synthase family protein [Nannocystis sp.]|jgi:hypothetical protein
MTRVAAAVDPTLLGRLLEWTQGFAGIEAHHAADGLFIGAAFRHDDLPDDPDAVFLVGLVITFWFWFDDRADRFLCAPETWDALIALGADPTHVTTIDTPETRFFQRLAGALRERAGDPAEHRWWLSCSADVFRSMRAEEQMTRAGVSLSYAEALEIGADSTALTSILSAADLAHGMNRAARGADQRLARVERYMCLSQRLLNDLNSAEKERREGHAGRVSNIVLLLEATMSPAQARAFVETQRHGYERMTLESIALLGPDDGFGRLIHDGMRNIRRWYETGPVRYENRGGAA